MSRRRRFFPLFPGMLLPPLAIEPPSSLVATYRYARHPQKFHTRARLDVLAPPKVVLAKGPFLQWPATSIAIIYEDFR